MDCPLHRKFCTPKAYKEYECGSWFCSGTKERKSPGGVKMDVIRLCGDGYFLKRECIIECTPDEAATLGALLSSAAAEWLNDSDDYNDFIAENDK
jgi:hypothetical protein